MHKNLSKIIDDVQSVIPAIDNSLAQPFDKRIYEKMPEGTFVQKVHNYDDQTVLCAPCINAPFSVPGISDCKIAFHKA